MADHRFSRRGIILVLQHFPRTENVTPGSTQNGSGKEEIVSCVLLRSNFDPSVYFVVSWIHTTVIVFVLKVWFAFCKYLCPHLYPNQYAHHAGPDKRRHWEARKKNRSLVKPWEKPLSSSAVLRIVFANSFSNLRTLCLWIFLLHISTVFQIVFGKISCVCANIT